MTHLEACAYERIEELEREVEQLKIALDEMNKTFIKITDVIEDEQVRRKWGVSKEPEELRTLSEWERLKDYHIYRAKAWGCKSSEQWLKDHDRLDELKGKK